MAIFCLNPENSSSDDSPNHTPHKATNTFNTNQQTLKPAVPKSLQAIIQSEITAREQVEKIQLDELTQIDALFCATTQTQEIVKQEVAEYNALFAQQLFLLHLPVAAAIQTEEAQARTDLETMFKDDMVLAESTISKSQLFRSTTNTAPESKKSWSEWATGLLRRS